MKRVTALFLAICLMFSFAACDKKKDKSAIKTVEEVVEDIKYKSEDVAWSNFEITNTEVVDRVTDKENGSDIIRILLSMENEEIKIVQCYEVEYEFIEGEWQFRRCDGISHEKNQSVLIKNNMTANTLQSLLLGQRYFEVTEGTRQFNYFFSENYNGEFTDIAYPNQMDVLSSAEDLEKGTQTFNLKFTKKSSFFKIMEKINVELTYGVNGYSWSIENAYLTESSLEVITPNLYIVDEFFYIDKNYKIEITGVNSDGSLIGYCMSDGVSVPISESPFADSYIAGPYVYNRRYSDGQSNYFYINEDSSLQIIKIAKD